MATGDPASYSGPEVSVIVPVRDGAASIGRCLDALARQTHPVFELIVVDNGSSDDTARIARDHVASPRLVTEPRPGSYAARNAGLLVATAPVVAFTDADCMPEPGWLAAGLAALDDAGADLVGGAVRMQRSAVPTIWERYDRAMYLRQEDLVVHSGWAVTANLMVRRAVFDAVGEFDTRLQSSGDREFCLRAGRAGFRLVYSADARVEHAPRTSMREIVRVNRRVGAGLGTLAAMGQLPPWWRCREHWMRVGWVGVLVERDGPRVRLRRLLPVHTVAMGARLYGRFEGRLAARSPQARTSSR